MHDGLRRFEHGVHGEIGEIVLRRGIVERPTRIDARPLMATVGGHAHVLGKLVRRRRRDETNGPIPAAPARVQQTLIPVAGQLHFEVQ